MSAPADDSNKKLETYRQMVSNLASGTSSSNSNNAAKSNGNLSTAVSAAASSSAARQWNLSALEKESEHLADVADRKLKSGKDKDGSPVKSTGILSWLTTWRRKRQVVKVQNIFETLVPKLKNTEEEVSLWLTALSEKKEATLQEGQRKLNEIESSILRYESHIDYYDELINDCRQVTFDATKEISDIRNAMLFNEEAVKAAGAALSWQQRQRLDSSPHILLEDIIEGDLDLMLEPGEVLPNLGSSDSQQSGDDGQSLSSSSSPRTSPHMSPLGGSPLGSPPSSPLASGGRKTMSLSSSGFIIVPGSDDGSVSPKTTTTQIAGGAGAGAGAGASDVELAAAALATLTQTSSPLLGRGRHSLLPTPPESGPAVWQGFRPKAEPGSPGRLYPRRMQNLHIASTPSTASISLSAHLANNGSGVVAVGGATLETLSEAGILYLGSGVGVSCRSSSSSSLLGNSVAQGQKKGSIGGSDNNNSTVVFSIGDAPQDKTVSRRSLSSPQLLTALSVSPIKVEEQQQHLQKSLSVGTASNTSTVASTTSVAPATAATGSTTAATNTAAAGTGTGTSVAAEQREISGGSDENHHGGGGGGGGGGSKSQHHHNGGGGKHSSSSKHKSPSSSPKSTSAKQRKHLVNASAAVVASVMAPPPPSPPLAIGGDAVGAAAKLSDNNTSNGGSSSGNGDNGTAESKQQQQQQQQSSPLPFDSNRKGGGVPGSSSVTENGNGCNSPPPSNSNINNSNSSNSISVSPSGASAASSTSKSLSSASSAVDDHHHHAESKKKMYLTVNDAEKKKISLTHAVSLSSLKLPNQPTGSSPPPKGLSSSNSSSSSGGGGMKSIFSTGGGSSGGGSGGGSRHQQGGGDSTPLSPVTLNSLLSSRLRSNSCESNEPSSPHSATEERAARALSTISMMSGVSVSTSDQAEADELEEKLRADNWQMEMIMKLNKCLAVKENVNRVIVEIKGSKDAVNGRLKAAKRLLDNLKNACSDDPSADKKDTAIVIPEIVMAADGHIAMVQHASPGAGGLGGAGGRKPVGLSKSHSAMNWPRGSSGEGGGAKSGPVATLLSQTSMKSLNAAAGNTAGGGGGSGGDHSADGGKTRGRVSSWSAAWSGEPQSPAAHRSTSVNSALFKLGQGGDSSSSSSSSSTLSSKGISPNKQQGGLMLKMSRSASDFADAVIMGSSAPPRDSHPSPISNGGGIAFGGVSSSSSSSAATGASKITHLKDVKRTTPNGLKIQLSSTQSSDSLRSHGGTSIGCPSPLSAYSSDVGDHKGDREHPGSFCVDELLVLSREEKKAKETLAQLTSLLDSASEVGKKLVVEGVKPSANPSPSPSRSLPVTPTTKSASSSTKERYEPSPPASSAASSSAAAMLSLSYPSSGKSATPPPKSGKEKEKEKEGTKKLSFSPSSSVTSVGVAEADAADAAYHHLANSGISSATASTQATVSTSNSTSSSSSAIPVSTYTRVQTHEEDPTPHTSTTSFVSSPGRPTHQRQATPFFVPFDPDTYLAEPGEMSPGTTRNLLNFAHSNLSTDMMDGDHSIDDELNARAGIGIQSTPQTATTLPPLSTTTSNYGATISMSTSTSSTSSSSSRR